VSFKIEQKNMKRLFIYIVLTTLTVTAAFAQKDADAKVILNKLSKQYRSYDAVKTDFTLTIDNQQANVKETQTGTLISRSKTNKYKVTLYAAGKKAVTQDIISDGKNQWTFLKDANEVQLSAAITVKKALTRPRSSPCTRKDINIFIPVSKKLPAKFTRLLTLPPKTARKTFLK
jgi:hypothetical protein